MTMRRAARPYDTTKPPMSSAAKRERHRQIRKYYEGEPRRRPPFNFAAKRVTDLNKIFGARYDDGPNDVAFILPDDDAGLDDAYLMICHLRACPAESSVYAWLNLHARWMTPT